MWMMAMMTVMVATGGVRRNDRTDQDDECNGSK
jgi:hypothetical protein